MANIFEIGRITSNHACFQDWLKENELIRKEVYCAICFTEMKAVKGRPQMICSQRQKHPDGKTVKESVYKETIFEGSRSTPENIIKIISCFCRKLTYDQTAMETTSGRNLISKWYNFCREMCMLSIR